METVEKICSCFGHGDEEITNELAARTKIVIDKAVADGVRIFYFGDLSRFDDLCCRLVSEKRQAEPQLNIRSMYFFALEKRFHRRPKWAKKSTYEGLECPKKDFECWLTSMCYRNMAMIDQSDLALFYVRQRENSGANKAYQYAVKRRKRLVNLFDKQA